jgi:hypothetical protein
MTLCAGFIGRFEKDDWLQRRAMTMYSQALRGLSTMMAAPNFIASDNVLAAVMCLGMAEVYSAPTQPEVDVGWASHNKGGCELLVSRGQSILRTDLGRGLLLRFRVTGVWTQLVYEASRIPMSGSPGLPNTAVERRKPFPFGESSLRQIARFASRNYYDHLIDIMVDIPSLLHDLEVMHHSQVNAAGSRAAGGSSRKGILRDILERGNATAEALTAWLVDFAAQHPSAWHCVHGPQVPGNAASDMFPHAAALRFQNLLTAQALTHLWAALVVLARCFAMCQDMCRGMDLDKDIQAACTQLFLCVCLSFPTSSLSTTGTPIGMVASGLHPLALGSRFADMICSATDYFTSPERGMSGPIILLFPLWLAKDIYTRIDDDLSRRKEAFCVNTFRKLADRGIKISEALASLSTKAF